MKLSISFSYFFNYIAENYSDYKMLRCFELQMPVKEVVFASLDKKKIQIGEVEKFILNGVLKLGRVSVEELDEIFHLGEAHIARILDDFVELNILQQMGNDYSFTDSGIDLLDLDREEVTMISEHSMLFDVFPNTEDTPLWKPVETNRYKRSLHQYNYPTEIENGRIEYNPICLGTVPITKDDIAKYIPLSHNEKREINFSENILQISKITNTYSYSHPLTFVIFFDKKGIEKVKVFDSCNISNLCEIKDVEAVLHNEKYLRHTFEEYFMPNSPKLIVDAFKQSRDEAYHINESDIISVEPAVIKVTGKKWEKRAASVYWYDTHSKLIVHLYPKNLRVANAILIYRILVDLGRVASGELDAENYNRYIKKTTEIYNHYLKKFGDVSAEPPSRDELFKKSIDYDFPKVSSDLQDIFDL